MTDRWPAVIFPSRGQLFRVTHIPCLRYDDMEREGRSSKKGKLREGKREKKENKDFLLVNRVIKGVKNRFFRFF